MSSTPPSSPLQMMRVNNRGWDEGRNEAFRFGCMYVYIYIYMYAHHWGASIYIYMCVFIYVNVFIYVIIYTG